MTWSPAGDARAFIDYRANKDSEGVETARGEIVQMTLDGQRETLISGLIQTEGLSQARVVASEGIVPFAFASWAPHGRTIIFTGLEYGSKETEKSQLMGGIYELDLKDRSVNRRYVVPLSDIYDNVSLFPTYSTTGALLAFTTISYENVPTASTMSVRHPEDSPTGNLYVYDFRQSKIVKKISGINPWIPPFWMDDAQVGYASMSGLGRALGGRKIESLEGEEHTENIALWLEDLQEGHRINLSDRMRSLILQQELQSKVAQLEAEARARKESEKTLLEKIEAQQAEFQQRIQQMDGTAKTVSELKTQVESKTQELESVKQDMKRTEESVKQERTVRQNAYTGFFIFVMILMAGMGIWIWWRTRLS
jgi:hypothetical protein